MQNEELHIAIDNYLKGKMNAEERLSFEYLLETNEEAKAIFLEAKMIRSLLAEQQFQLLSKQLREELKAGKVQEKNNNWKIGGAIIMLALIGTGSYMYLNNEPKQSGQIENVKATDSTSKSIFVEKAVENKIQPQILNDKVTFKKDETLVTKTLPKVEAVEKTPNDFEEKNLPKSTSNDYELPSKEPSIEVKTVECDKINWVATLAIEPSCADKATGKVRISKLEGGTKPFKTSLWNALNAEVTLDELSGGIYVFRISDANHCQHEKKVKVDSKTCLKKLELLFQPERDAELEIPLHESSGKWKLMNNAGTILYTDTFDSNSNIYKWDGNGTNGARIANGVYLLSIEYANGSSELGYITIY